MAITTPQFMVREQTTKVITIQLPDEVINQIRDAEKVVIELQSSAMNRPPAPITLGYTAIQRLTLDL